MDGVESCGIGLWLGKQRRQSGRSLADLAAQTRIRQTYLQALEEEEFDKLPGEIYLLGFLRIYAEALGLSPVEAVSRYRLKVPQASPAAEVPTGAFPLPRVSRPSKRRFVLPAVLLALVVTGLLLTTAGPKYEDASTATASSPPPPPPGAATAVTPLQNPAPPLASGPAEAVVQLPDSPLPPGATAPEPVPDAAGPERIVTLPSGGGVLKVEALTSCRLLVALNGKPAHDYQLLPGAVINWPVTSILRLSMAEPGRLRCWLDGRQLALLDHQGLVLQSPGAKD